MGDPTIRADVIVVGAGLAGLATALELLDGGRRVAVLDRCGEAGFGGLARQSFGGIFIVGSREQRRTGIRDSVELALRDWLAYGEIGEEETWPRRWAEAYVAGCREQVYDWLRELGVRFFPVVHWVERGLHAPGNSVPRFHMVWGTGERLVELLRRRVEEHSRRERLQ
ncbi:MAG: FAD-dependent oxidoreductase, partial [Acidobacteriota bacterium]